MQVKGKKVINVDFEDGSVFDYLTAFRNHEFKKFVYSQLDEAGSDIDEVLDYIINNWVDLTEKLAEINHKVKVEAANALTDNKRK